MKKALLLGLALFGTVALTGCDMINSLISGEKQYNYNDFKALLADRKLSFDATKATAKIKRDDKEETREYTWDKDNSNWTYTYYDEDFRIDMKGTAQLDVINNVLECELSAALANKKTDDLFKFYATNNSYRFTGVYEDDDQKVELEYKFREDGLKTSQYTKTTDLRNVKSSEETYTFTYSK